MYVLLFACYGSDVLVVFSCEDRRDCLAANVYIKHAIMRLRDMAIPVEFRYYDTTTQPRLPQGVQLSRVPALMLFPEGVMSPPWP